MRFIYFSLFSLTCLVSSHAEDARSWKNDDGSKTFQGKFVKRDATTVTIKRSANLQEITLPIAKLHADDVAWLNTNHPNKSTSTTSKPKPPPSTGIFDNLNFGDSRQQVQAKLKTCKIVKPNIDEALWGRTGLNGVFETRTPLGGITASLYFDWNEQGGLKEITLQTNPLPASAVESKLTPCWKEMVELLTEIYGAPIVGHDSFSIEGVADGALSPTHLWDIEPKGSASLGVARDGNRYQIAVRFTAQKAQTVPIN